MYLHLLYMKRKGSTGYAVQHLEALPSLTLARLRRTSCAEILPTENIIPSLHQCPSEGKGVVLLIASARC